ncbi:hypothetical protein GH714_038625 [Hevea brasiliensis]|uniref:DUF4283 domain-containing protein n=1 Tax=Hevea brasiliensis TaxID=3981 RepID=A0A6A6NA07_HEVBR|nr:hypothetical protein GH714_038625 [Hevea brasiliensis]
MSSQMDGVVVGNFCPSKEAKEENRDCLARLAKLGGDEILLSFDSKEIMDGFVNVEESWLSQWVDDLKPWEPEFIPSKSIVWLKLQGMPLNVWTVEFFKWVGYMWGESLQRIIIHEYNISAVEEPFVALYEHTIYGQKGQITQSENEDEDSNAETSGCCSRGEVEENVGSAANGTRSTGGESSHDDSIPSAHGDALKSMEDNIKENIDNTSLHAHQSTSLQLDRETPFVDPLIMLFEKPGDDELAFMSSPIDLGIIVLQNDERALELDSIVRDLALRLSH